MVDYLVVGYGLAGMCFSQVALEKGKTALIVDDKKINSSRIAAGLINPVVLKRFTAVWKAEEQIDLLTQFYQRIEKLTGNQYLFDRSILRKLASVEEQNNWFSSADKTSLSRFLRSELVKTKYNFVDSPFHFGEVAETGFLNISSILDDTIVELQSKKLYIDDSFDYNVLKIHRDHIEYKGYKAKQIVFTEGFGMNQNPFFNYLPLDGTKGEVITIKATDLAVDKIIKAGVFIMPIGNSLYRVGATYNWKDKDNIPTEEGKKELVQKLKDIISCDFEIIEHQADVRPTVKDRRPLVGRHKDYSNVYLLNGLGTRGVMLGPYLAYELYDHIEMGKSLDPQIDIIRYS